MQKRSSSLLLGPQIKSVPEGDRPTPLVKNGHHCDWLFKPQDWMSVTCKATRHLPLILNSEPSPRLIQQELKIKRKETLKKAERETPLLSLKHSYTGRNIFWTFTGNDITTVITVFRREKISQLHNRKHSRTESVHLHLKAWRRGREKAGSSFRPVMSPMDRTARERTVRRENRKTFLIRRDFLDQLLTSEPALPRFTMSSERWPVELRPF